MRNFKVGERVCHTGHGYGVVLEVNQNEIDLIRVNFEHMNNERLPALTRRVAAEHYARRGRPYTIRFDSGYSDCYEHHDELESRSTMFVGEATAHSIEQFSRLLAGRCHDGRTYAETAAYYLARAEHYERSRNDHGAAVALRLAARYESLALQGV